MDVGMLQQKTWECKTVGELWVFLFSDKYKPKEWRESYENSLENSNIWKCELDGAESHYSDKMLMVYGLLLTLQNEREVIEPILTGLWEDLEICYYG